MEQNKNKLAASSSSFTMDLFGPKHSSPSNSSTGVFGSVFGPPPPSMGLGRDSSISGGTARNHDYGNTKQGIQDYNNSQRNYKGESGGKQSKDKTSPSYNQSESNPCYYSSSIYYGGQEVYSPDTQSKSSAHHAMKKNDGGDDPHGNNSTSASRGNWWEGSLYY